MKDKGLESVSKLQVQQSAVSRCAKVQTVQFSEECRHSSLLAAPHTARGHGRPGLGHGKQADGDNIYCNYLGFISVTLIYFST